MNHPATAMRIALFKIGDFFNVIGATEPYYVYRFLRRRHRVWAVVPDDNGRSDTQGCDDLVVRVPRLFGLPTLLSYNLLAPLYLFKANSFQMDLIYTYKGVITPILLFKFVLGRRWVCDFRTAPVEQDLEIGKVTGRLSILRRLKHWMIRRFYRFTLPYSDLVVAISEEVKQRLINDYNVPAHKIHVQPLGVDLELFAPGRTESKLGNELRIVYVGAITMQRCLGGLDTVIKALGKLRELLPVKLFIVGRGSPEAIDHLKDLADKLGVGEQIEWVGYIPHTQVPDVLDACQVALSPLPPLRAYQVSSPSKIFEYLAMGKVVVATDILAHRKLIQDKENGLLVPPGDDQVLAATLEEIYRNADLRSRLTKNARNSVKAYSWDVLLPELERKIRRTLEE